MRTFTFYVSRFTHATDSDHATPLPHMTWAGAGIMLLAIAAVFWFGRREAKTEVDLTLSNMNLTLAPGSDIPG